MLAHTEHDFLRRAVTMLLQQLMEADVTQHIGATCDIAVPYLFLDATSRCAKIIVSCRMPCLLRWGLREGTRRILDVMMSAGEDFSSWELFLRRLVDRSLHGV